TTDANFAARVVGPDAVGQAKPPGVPRTRDHPVLHEAAAQGGAHVRANVVNGVVLALMMEQGDEPVAYLYHGTLPFRQRADAADGLKVGHVFSRQNSLDRMK